MDRWKHRLHSRPLWRDAAVAGLRFVPGARTPSALVARSTGVGTLRFCLLAGVGSLAWASLWTGASRVAWATPADLLLWGLAGAVVVATAGVIWRSAERPLVRRRVVARAEGVGS